MKTYIHILLVVIFILSLSACEKAEKAIMLPEKPNDSMSLIQVDLGEQYDNQVYINFLNLNPIRNTIKNNSWDLAFDCAPESFRICMNGGKGVFIGVIGNEEFIKNVDINKVKWRWDEASGGDSIVLKNWCNAQNRHSFDSIYIIDRGLEAEPGKRYFQFQIKNANFGTYRIEVADISGTKLYNAFITKDFYKNYVYFDFGKPQILNFEPKFDDWQFCFLRCRWIYYEFNPPLIYPVTGIHINPKLVSVAIDSSMDFQTIGKKQVEQLKFSNRRDIMGFEWKVYDFNRGQYLTRKYVNYIFRTKFPVTKYYKLRFTDYYSKQGIKGSPKFELTEIK